MEEVDREWPTFKFYWIKCTFIDGNGFYMGPKSLK